MNPLVKHVWFIFPAVPIKKSLGLVIFNSICGGVRTCVSRMVSGVIIVFFVVDVVRWNLSLAPGLANFFSGIDFMITAMSVMVSCESVS